MDLISIAEKLGKKGISVLRNEHMLRHTSFKIGGPVELMVLPKSSSQVEAAVTLLRAIDVEPLVIGNGTNLLVTDAPLRKIIIKTHNGLGFALPDGENAIEAGSGALLSRAAVLAKEMGLTGMEFARGIPGSLGGAITMNAGAYGGQMSDIIRNVVFLDEDGKRCCRENEELDFSYRHSVFCEKKCVILSASIALSPGDSEEIKDRMDELSQKRRASQPLEFPSAGSTFKRPANGYAAALIEQVGLKGYTVGGAQVSEKHSGFVINRGGATYRDVRMVMDHVMETVYKKAGIVLEPEVRIIE